MSANNGEARQDEGYTVDPDGFYGSGSAGDVADEVDTQLDADYAALAVDRFPSNPDDAHEGA